MLPKHSKQILCILLIVLLLGCFLRAPYYYYDIVRIISTVIFGFFVFDAFKNNKLLWVFIFSTYVLLFNPISKFAFKKLHWQIIDVSAIIIIIIVLTLEFRKKSRNG